MSCKYDLLLNAALRRLRRVPATLLRDLTQEFRVSRRTLENAISMTTGKTFREVRDEVLVKQVKNLLESRPTRGIKELCFELGYKSPRSFSRR
jgi:AraC-like DNA-binding protein